MKEGERGPFFPKLRLRIKDNNSSPHGKFYPFLFPFSSKIFRPKLRLICSLYLPTHSEPGLPVVRIFIKREQSLLFITISYELWLQTDESTPNCVDKMEFLSALDSLKEQQKTIKSEIYFIRRRHISSLKKRRIQMKSRRS